ncbi:MAG: NG,NG-dimethylarginine dimethylaminohydrolase 1 [Gemmataceae bacterium]|nr:NG,NG-dimethylarginine dimethylaminohydrolase 1 [Gemmataceae bacterium]
MLTAVTRSPGRELGRCQLTHLPRRPIDTDRALAQHRAYQAALRDAGARVIGLPADPALPDGVFVEDAAVVLDELAVITSPTPPSRRAERGAVGVALAPFRRIVRLPPDAFLEGGDVLRVGRTLYVGLSARTGEAGLRALDGIVRPLGYAVVPVRVTGCLHLKSAACAVDDATVLINRGWVEVGPFSGLRQADVPAAEPFGANVLRLPGAVLVSTAHPGTADLVRGLGHRVVTLDVSELHKAESGLTCMSLVFEGISRADRDDGFTLRAATNADGEAIRRVVWAVLGEFGFTPDPAGTDADLAVVEASYLRTGGAFEVLTGPAGEVVGTVGLFPLGDGRCELRKMYLAAACRGRGLGKRLLRHALDRACGLGFRRVELETVGVLRVAIELYESFGFRPFVPDHWSAGPGRADRAYALDLG